MNRWGRTVANRIEWYQLEWGFRLQYPGGGDVIRITDLRIGTPGEIQFALRSAPDITWRKSIRLHGTQADFGEAYTVGGDHGPKLLTVPVVPPALSQATLLFSKAATLGVDTGMYAVGDLLRYEGRRVEFTWLWDWGAGGAPGPEHPVFLHQHDWRWCHKCQGLFYAGSRLSNGRCPAGGQHERGASGDYGLAHDASGFPGQDDWRWCRNCQGLFYAGGHPTTGACPSGGAHDGSVSGNYALIHNSSSLAPGQDQWRWCHRCQGLFYAGGGPQSGTCPAAEHHDQGVSGNYKLKHAA